MCQIGSAVGRARRVPRSKALLAYRGWNLTSGGRLVPTFFPENGPWTRFTSSNADPTPGNLSGLYAFKHRFRAAHHGQVQGVVRVWGLVVETTRGYRATNAEIVSLRLAPMWKGDPNSSGAIAVDANRRRICDAAKQIGVSTHEKGVKIK